MRPTHNSGRMRARIPAASGVRCCARQVKFLSWNDGEDPSPAQHTSIPHTRSEWSLLQREPGQVLVVERRRGSVACLTRIAALQLWLLLADSDQLPALTRLTDAESRSLTRSEEHRKQSSELPDWTCSSVLCCQPLRGC